MNNLLSLILLILLILISGKRGIKTYLTIYINLFILLILIILICWGINPIIPTLIICLIISTLILFFLNGFNQKTISAFISVSIILIIFILITIITTSKTYIQGYTEETIESIGYINYDTGLNMRQITISVILIGLIGTITDTAIAISSSLFEVHQNNPKLNKKELFISGMNIGKDILGTTINTLFFAYLGGYMTIFIYFQDFSYSIVDIINSKLFAEEFINIVLSGLSSVLIIPVSSYITSLICQYEGNDFYEKNEYNLRRQEYLSNRQGSKEVNNRHHKRKRKNTVS